MDEIYLYIVDIPGTAREMVVPCCDGYTVYIDVKLSYSEKLDAYHHAMEHIRNNDWQSKLTVDVIEEQRHEKAI